MMDFLNQNFLDKKQLTKKEAVIFLKDVWDLAQKDRQLFNNWQCDGKSEKSYKRRDLT